jgi:hypothetical protein
MWIAMSGWPRILGANRQLITGAAPNIAPSPLAVLPDRIDKLCDSQGQRSDKGHGGLALRKRNMTLTGGYLRN